MKMHSILIVTTTITLLSLVSSAKTTAGKEDSSPPPFFLQDPSDSLCLAGETFKRCSIDTLFYVDGSPGTYKIHKRPSNGVLPSAEDDDGLCLAKKSCKESDALKVMPMIVTKCSHCGAKLWNILGDGDTGYVLTEGSDDDATGKTCVFRKENTVLTAPCDSEQLPYTPLQLRFASATDIKTMGSPGARMIAAANDGDIATITSLVKDEKIDINSRDWDELTALVPAASSGHMNICKFLVENGIDVNAADKDGITALMEASIMGHVDIVTYLIQSGATVDAEATSEVTALWLAASEGQTACMKVLLEKGASATNTRSDGITALMTAAVGGHADAVKLLIEHGADPTTVDKEGLTPLMNAAENGTVPVLQVLVEATKNDPKYINAISNSGFSALIIASAHGHAKAVEYLLSVGADKNVHAADNQVTALMFASASNHVDVVRVLLDSGCEIDAKHSNGGTALLEASTGGAVDAIQVLIEKGAAVDITDDDGVTPLMAIASQGNETGFDIIMDTLRRKFNNDPTKLKEFINLFSKSGGSTVMFATAGGHAEATKKLIAAGADVNAIARATPDYIVKITKMKQEGTSNEIDEHVDGVSALHVAAQGGHLAAVNVLVEAGVDVTMKDDSGRSALLLAIKGNYGKVATALVKAGADPNMPYVDDDGVAHNLLFDAIMVENVDFATLLIEKGANIYYSDEKNVSTLLQASHRGLVDVVKALLEKHAASGDTSDYLNAPSDEGISPLIAASSEGHPEVVKLLIGYKGVNLNSIDQDKTTSLMAASARGHFKVVQALLEAGAAVNEQNMDGHTALMFAYNGKNQVETLWERYTQYVNDAKKTSSADSTSAAATTKNDNDIDDSGTGPIIREALDNHLALVEMLLKAGADTTLKDKEGHTAKDFDYNPDVDSDSLLKSAKNEKLKDESKYEL